MSPGPALISLVTLWILTTSYYLRHARTCARQPFSRRRPGSRERGLCGQSAARKTRSSAVPSVPCVKAPPLAFGFTPSPAQQRWADRPAHLLLPMLMVTFSPGVITPPTTPFHLSAHRYCAWNRPFFPSSTTPRCFPSKRLEAIALINGFAGAQKAELPTSQTLNSFDPHREVQALREFTQHLPAPVSVISKGKEEPAGMGGSAQT